MAVTDWKSPTSNATVGTGSWLNPTNAYTENGSFAQGEYSSTGAVRFSMSFNGGTSFAVTGQSQALTTTNTTYTQGDSSDLWSQSLSPSSFNSNSFYIRIKDEWNLEHDFYGFGCDIPASAKIDGLEIKIRGLYNTSNGFLEVDHIQMRVYYTESTPTVGVKYPLPAFKR